MENARVVWFFNGRKVKDGKMLKIEYLTHESEGLFECEASNSYGVDKKSIRIDLSSPTTYEHKTKDEREDEKTTTAHHNQESNRKNINIQVLSNPATDHVENGRVKLRCISDIENAVYSWSILNRTLPSNVMADDDLLVLDPFTRESAGVYRCLAYNHELNQQASRRININVDSKPKKTVDLSDRIKIDMVSSIDEMKIGGNVKLKCHVGQLNTHILELNLIQFTLKPRIYFFLI